MARGKNVTPVVVAIARDMAAWVSGPSPVMLKWPTRPPQEGEGIDGYTFLTSFAQQQRRGMFAHHHVAAPLGYPKDPPRGGKGSLEGALLSAGA